MDNKKGFEPDAKLGLIVDDYFREKLGPGTPIDDYTRGTGSLILIAVNLWMEAAKTGITDPDTGDPWFTMGRFSALVQEAFEEYGRISPE